MLEHWLTELIGQVSGLSDAQLKQIEKSLPATKALVDLLNTSTTDHRTGAKPVH